jgi:hypothetical protein
VSSAPEDHEDRLVDRREERLRALGTRYPRCSVPGCEESDPFALTGVDPNILCRDHLAAMHGRSWVEQHHPAGRHNDQASVPVPANDHGALSEHQALWPPDTLRNAHGSPLLRMAAWIRGWLAIVRVMERTLGRIPASLERLDALLSDRIGQDWWEALGWRW